jgi:2-oxoglutarate ferredoxin oxidoreductase subunit delta
MMRNFMAKTPWGTPYVRLVTPKCKACWRCMEACPSSVFDKTRFLGHEQVRIARPGNCTGCLKCLEICPFTAIESAEKHRNKGVNRKISNRRAVVSVGLFILFVLLIVSAIMIGIEEDDPQLRSHHVWAAFHTHCGIISMGFVTFHLIYNWKVFRSHLSKKNK